MRKEERNNLLVEMTNQALVSSQGGQFTPFSPVSVAGGPASPTSPGPDATLTPAEKTRLAAEMTRLTALPWEYNQHYEDAVSHVVSKKLSFEDKMSQYDSVIGTLGNVLLPLLPNTLANRRAVMRALLSGVQFRPEPEGLYFLLSDDILRLLLRRPPQSPTGTEVLSPAPVSPLPAP